MALPVLFLFSLAGAPAAALDLDDTTYQNRALGIKVMEVPEEWALHRDTGFPSMPAVMTHGRASIGLSVVFLDSTASLKTLQQHDQAGLQKIGIQVTSTRSTTIQGSRALRSTAKRSSSSQTIIQIYIKRGPRAYILTLTCPASKQATYRLVLSQLADTIQLTTPADASGEKAGERPTLGPTPDGPVLDDGTTGGPEQGDMDETPEQSSKPTRRARPIPLQPPGSGIQQVPLPEGPQSHSTGRPPTRAAPTSAPTSAPASAPGSRPAKPPRPGAHLRGAGGSSSVDSRPSAGARRQGLKGKSR